MTNQEAMQIPWSVEQTIENLKIIKKHYQEVVRKANRDGMGEQDAMEVAFDFDRAIAALEEQAGIDHGRYEMGETSTVIMCKTKDGWVTVRR